MSTLAEPVDMVLTGGVNSSRTGRNGASFHGTIPHANRLIFPLFLFLLLASWLPVLLDEIPPLIDYPNHLALVPNCR